MEFLPDSGHAVPSESGETMSRRARRNHTPAFKAKVALAATWGRPHPCLSATACPDRAVTVRYVHPRALMAGVGLLVSALALFQLVRSFG